MTIWISLPVHEQSEVVIDQCRNLLDHVRDARIVLHVSRGFQGALEPLLDYARDEQRVQINPARLETRWGDILNVHAANLALILKQAQADDPVCFHSSNDLLVRGGVHALFARHDAAFMHDSTLDLRGADPMAAAVNSDALAMELFARHGIDTVVWSQIEGSFYPASVLRALLPELLRFVAERPQRAYFTEEIILPTLARAELLRQSRRRFARPYVFSEISMVLAYRHALRPVLRSDWLTRVACSLLRRVGAARISRPVVTRVRHGDSRLLRFWSSGAQARYAPGHLYGVKRVERRIDDPLRAWIRRTNRDELKP